MQTGVDLTNGGDTKSWSKDELSHGTHCAGVIGAAPGPVQPGGAHGGAEPGSLARAERDRG